MTWAACYKNTLKTIDVFSVLMIDYHVSFHIFKPFFVALWPGHAQGYTSLIIHSSAGHFWGRRAGHGIPDLKTQPENYFDLPLPCPAGRVTFGELWSPHNFRCFARTNNSQSQVTTKSLPKRLRLESRNLLSITRQDGFCSKTEMGKIQSFDEI